MRQSRFTEERIIAILREHEAGSKTRATSAQIRRQQRDFLQLEGQVWRAPRIRAPAVEGSDGRERQAEKAAGRGDVRQAMLKDLNAKNDDARCAKRQAVARHR